MKPEQIFIGNIRRCTKYESHPVYSSNMYVNEQCLMSESFERIKKEDELYKEHAILIKIERGGYVDLERFNSILDHIRIHRDITKNGYRLGGLMMPTSAQYMGNLFVDEKSLKPYYTDNKQNNNISVRQLKKQIIKNR